MASSSPVPSSSSPVPTPVGIVVEDWNLSPVLQLTTWLTLAFTALMLGFRLLTRFFIKKGSPFAMEDGLMNLSFTLGIGESATMLTPQSEIFGKARTHISDAEMAAGLKAGFARDILFILCICFAKLSVCAGLMALSPHRGTRRLVTGLSALIACLSISSLFTVAFRCGTIGPWDYISSSSGPKNDQCVDMQRVLLYVGITNILTDAALVALPIAIISPLHMALSMRLHVMSFYSARILAIIATILQLAYLARIFEDGADWTLASFPYYMCMQLVQFASISSACLVYFWPLMRSLRSGLMNANNTSFALSQKYPLDTLSQKYPKSSSRDSRSAVVGLSTSTSGQRDRRQKEYIEISTDISAVRDDEDRDEERGGGRDRHSTPGLAM